MKVTHNEFQEALLAGLLHDIGKFYQRAGYSLQLKTQGDEYDYYEFTKKVGEGAQTKYYYQHAALTAKFFREYLPKYDSAGVLAALHHVPEKADAGRRLLAKIISLADRMSSGERSGREESEESGNPQEEPLISIFSKLRLDNIDSLKEEKEFFIPLSELNDDLSAIFPVSEKKKAFSQETGQKTYHSLWQRFISELGKLEKQDFLAQIYHLLYKYTLSMPAAVYRDKPDISLFHHLKSTAAIVASLYRLINDQRALPVDEKYIDRIFSELKEFNKDSQRSNFEHLSKADFLLVGGDISGIQEFIYEITSEKALKGLRARSLYLQLISEVIARKVLMAFELNEINMLYCGGGNFYLLLPNLSNSEEKLKSIQAEIDKILLKAHKGKLTAILSWIPISYFDFFKDFASVWQQAGKELALKKRKKFSSLIRQGGVKDFKESVLGPYDLGGENKGCLICGEEIEKDGPDTCDLCQSFIDLAGDLNRAEILLIKPSGRSTLPEKIKNWWEVPEALGYDCRFISTDKKTFPFNRNAYLINSVDFAGRADGFVFIARKTNSSETGQPLTLEDMAGAASGIKKWGVFRADVDRLGELFQNGLGDNKTISRVSMLSTLLSLYFSARMSQIENWSEGDQVGSHLAKDVYIAYAGGDDLFLIGPWSVLIDLAGCLRNDFSEFTCGKLTISAGIFYAPGKKFPVYQAARMSGEAEDQAKNDGRNRLNVFGESMEWTCLPTIKEIVEIVTGLLQGENGKAVPRSLLSVLYNIHHEKQLKKENRIKMERVWRLHYSLKKLMGKLNDKQKQDLNKLLELILVNYEIYPYLNIATRVADYLTRN
ncbi:MAG: type III-A CRISPR-associated protein Cas10/Csm1 [Candidatus Saccharicenans sp.]